jgi:hypothetical protein
MEPCNFEGSNVVLQRPDGMTDEECAPLCVRREVLADTYPVVMSCWKLTEEEFQELLKTKRVWLTVYGVTMPPVALTTVKPFA